MRDNDVVLTKSKDEDENIIDRDGNNKTGVVKPADTAIYFVDDVF